MIYLKIPWKFGEKNWFENHPIFHWNSIVFYWISKISFSNISRHDIFQKPETIKIHYWSCASWSVIFIYKNKESHTFSNLCQNFYKEILHLEQILHVNNFFRTDSFFNPGEPFRNHRKILTDGFNAQTELIRRTNEKTLSKLHHQNSQLQNKKPNKELITQMIVLYANIHVNVNNHWHIK